MLVLKRRINETIRIGQDVVIRVLEARSGQVGLAIQAPREVVVLRGELAAQEGRADDAEVERAAAAAGAGGQPARV